jgi:hypothetical protein
MPYLVVYHWIVILSPSKILVGVWWWWSTCAKISPLGRISDFPTNSIVRMMMVIVFALEDDRNWRKGGIDGCHHVLTLFSFHYHLLPHNAAL